MTSVSAATSTAGYRIDISTDGTQWTTLGTVDAAASQQTSVDGGGVNARYVRYQAPAGVTPWLTSLTVN